MLNLINTYPNLRPVAKPVLGFFSLSFTSVDIKQGAFKLETLLFKSIIKPFFGEILPLCAYQFSTDT